MRKFEVVELTHQDVEDAVRKYVNANYGLSLDRGSYRVNVFMEDHAKNRIKSVVVEY